MSSLQIQPFEASPALSPPPYSASSPLLPKHTLVDSQPGDSGHTLRSVGSRLKSRYRALPILARALLFVVVLGPIYLLRSTWSNSMFDFPIPSLRNTFVSSDTSRAITPLVQTLDPAFGASSQAFDHPSATSLDEELKLLPQAFRMVSGAYPTPLFPLPRLSQPQERRYAHLRGPPDQQDIKPGKSVVTANDGQKEKYMLVAILKNVDHILYDLINTILVLTSFLGPNHISLSIIEGPSTDESASLLEDVLYPALLRMGVKSSDINLHLNAEKVDWHHRNRIELLAELRNQALSPVWLDKDSGHDGDALIRRERAANGQRSVGKDVRAIAFFNDVFLSASHILELFHQHVQTESTTGQRPSMTTAMDYRIGNDNEETFFYDVWVSRLVENGDMFRDFPHEGDGHHLFRGFDHLKEKYKTLSPFQAYCAWNGVAVIDPKVFLPPYNVRFRRSDLKAGECAASECSLFCNDLWRMGLGRIQVVPSVRVAYDLNIATRTLMETEDAKAENGWYEGVPPEEELRQSFDWVEDPPRLIRCFPWPEATGSGQWPWIDFKWVKPWLDFPKRWSSVEASG